MCGRYEYTPGEFREIRIRWNLDKDLPLFKPCYNIAPGKQVPVIVREGEHNQMKLMRWGLVPSWSQDPSIGNRMINARVETLDQKPSFKRLLSSRRCLVPASGFYEWRRERKRKVPMHIVRKDRKLLTFAGLWDMWMEPEGSELYTFTIITTEANALLRSIHDRMPVIMDDLAASQWLDPVFTTPKTLLILLQPCPSEWIEAHEVSTLVNNPANDSPECVQQVEG